MKDSAVNTETYDRQLNFFFVSSPDKRVGLHTGPDSSF